ncbi:MAG: hypothetical protein WBX30_29790 [Stellaceae bacterium]
MPAAISDVGAEYCRIRRATSRELFSSSTHVIDHRHVIRALRHKPMALLNLACR